MCYLARYKNESFTIVDKWTLDPVICSNIEYARQLYKANELNLSAIHKDSRRMQTSSSYILQIALLSVHACGQKLFLELP